MVGIINLSCFHLLQEANLRPLIQYLLVVLKVSYNYLMRTIPGISQFLYPLEETVRSKFIPAITGGHICCNNEQRLFSLPTRYGG